LEKKKSFTKIELVGWLKVKALSSSTSTAKTKCEEGSVCVYVCVCVCVYMCPLISFRRALLEPMGLGPHPPVAITTISVRTWGLMNYVCGEGGREHARVSLLIALVIIELYNNEEEREWFFNNSQSKRAAVEYS
jgi:hypothetical protein